MSREAIRHQEVVVEKERLMVKKKSTLNAHLPTIKTLASNFDNNDDKEPDKALGSTSRSKEIPVPKEDLPMIVNRIKAPALQGKRTSIEPKITEEQKLIQPINESALKDHRGSAAPRIVKQLKQPYQKISKHQLQNLYQNHLSPVGKQQIEPMQYRRKNYRI